MSSNDGWVILRIYNNKLRAYYWHTRIFSDDFVSINEILWLRKCCSFLNLITAISAGVQCGKGSIIHLMCVYQKRK